MAPIDLEFWRRKASTSAQNVNSDSSEAVNGAPEVQTAPSATDPIPSFTNSLVSGGKSSEFDSRTSIPLSTSSGESSILSGTSSSRSDVSQPISSATPPIISTTPGPGPTPTSTVDINPSAQLPSDINNVAKPTSPGADKSSSIPTETSAAPVSTASSGGSGGIKLPGDIGLGSSGGAQLELNGNSSQSTTTQDASTISSSTTEDAPPAASSTSLAGTSNDNNSTSSSIPSPVATSNVDSGTKASSSPGVTTSATQAPASPSATVSNSDGNDTLGTTSSISPGGGASLSIGVTTSATQAPPSSSAAVSSIGDSNDSSTGTNPPGTIINAGTTISGVTGGSPSTPTNVSSSPPSATSSSLLGDQVPVASGTASSDDITVGTSVQASSPPAAITSVPGTTNTPVGGNVSASLSTSVLVSAAAPAASSAPGPADTPSTLTSVPLPSQSSVNTQPQSSVLIPSASSPSAAVIPVSGTTSVPVGGNVSASLSVSVGSAAVPDASSAPAPADTPSTLTSVPLPSQATGNTQPQSGVLTSLASPTVIPAASSTAQVTAPLTSIVVNVADHASSTGTEETLTLFTTSIFTIGSTATPTTINGQVTQVSVPILTTQVSTVTTEVPQPSSHETVGASQSSRNTAVIGGSIGAVLALLTGLILFIFLRRRRRILEHKRHVQDQMAAMFSSSSLVAPAASRGLSHSGSNSISSVVSETGPRVVRKKPIPYIDPVVSTGHSPSLSTISGVSPVSEDPFWASLLSQTRKSVSADPSITGTSTSASRHTSTLPNPYDDPRAALRPGVVLPSEGTTRLSAASTDNGRPGTFSEFGLAM